LIVDKKSL